MKRSTIGWIAGLAALSLVLLWVARNTEWTGTTFPLPPAGEAATNPFYATQRFAEALGARTAWDRQLIVPSTNAVMVLSAWHWDLTEQRRYSLERWVESGGRLVVTGPLAGGEDEFERWSGITRGHHRRRREDPMRPPAAPDLPCEELTELRDGTTPLPGTRGVTVCGVELESYLRTTRKPLWGLTLRNDLQAVRVAAGKGTVTVINASPFRGQDVLLAEHHRLFVAATSLRREDDVHFLTENEHPSLLALTWMHGSPVVVLGLTALALGLWRNSSRFGPLVNEPAAARRSLAEQIRGTGQFAVREGDGESLHAATLRALSEAAARRIPGYVRMPQAERAAALAGLTGFDRDAFSAAALHAGLRTPGELRQTIAFLETARRQILSAPTSSTTADTNHATA
jgi:hypothetical protein